MTPSDAARVEVIAGVLMSSRLNGTSAEVQEAAEMIAARLSADDGFVRVPERAGVYDRDGRYLGKGVPMPDRGMIVGAIVGADGQITWGDDAAAGEG